jgi:hypothetical protein
MAIEFNGKTNRKVPIKRNNKFFGGEDFDLELDFAKEYIEQDANQTVILYRVDLDKTQVNDIYKEAKKDAIRFLPPIELPVVYEIGESEMKAYGTKLQKGIYAQTGKLTFTVLLSTLEEYGCDISRGDYIGVQIDSTHREYFTVTDDGRVATTSNRYSLYGTMPYARKIECASVDLGEFNG